MDTDGCELNHKAGSRRGNAGWMTVSQDGDAELSAMDTDAPGMGGCAVLCHRRFCFLNDREKKCAAVNCVLGFLFFLALLVCILLLLRIIQLPCARDQLPPHSQDYVQVAGRVLANMDQRADPCVNFQQYACGGWEKETHIPDGKPSVKDNDENAEDVMQFFKDQLSWKISKDDILAYRKAQQFYNSCMDTSSINSAGAAPLITWVRSKGGLRLLNTMETLPGVTKADMMTDILVESIKANVDLVFTVHAIINASIQKVLWIKPLLAYKYGHLSRLYGKRENDQLYAEVLGIIFNVQRIFYSGSSVQTAKRTLRILVRLAKASLASPVFQFDAQELHTIGYMSENVSDAINWTRLVEKLAIDVDEQEIPNLPVFVFFKKSVSSLLHVFHNESKRDVSNALWTLFVLRLFGYLSEDYRKDRKEVLGGNDKLDWRACVKYTTELIREPTEALFIQRYFENNQEVKNEVEEMVADIKGAFFSRINSLTWMDDGSKQLAIEKASSMLTKIAYPDKLLNHTYVNRQMERLQFGKSFFQNVITATNFEVNNTLKTLYKPIDNTRFRFPIHISQAFYYPAGNYFSLFSGYLQTPFYDRRWPSYMKYGAAGKVIGHEITHGFDNIGSGYDRFGNRRQWWSENVSQAFQERTQCFVDQFNQYQFFRPSMNKTFKIDGNLTLSENIADAGGLRNAYYAYKSWVRKHGPERVLPGFPANTTVDQLFFLAMGQLFCSKFTDTYLQWYLKNDPHVPWVERANAVMINSEEFAKAYNCPKGSRLNPVQKCQIW